jgi:retinol-binding protein 3
MKSIKIIAWGIAMILMLFSSNLFAQNGSQIITEQQKQTIFQKAIELLNENYLFPERVKAIESFIKKKFLNKGYSQFGNLPDFLQEFNKDLEREGNDHHLDVFFGPQRVKQIKRDQQNENKEKVEALSEEWLELLKYENFRLRKVERLDGNIGYFQFLNFAPLAPAKESIVAAMNFIRQSSAVVIDLRENGGGNAETMNFLLSYFLKDSLQTGEWRYRKENKIEKTYIPADPAIVKIPDSTPVYILVSNKTSSAAEGFSYILQQFKRAVIVGEQTKGEGNPGKLFIINDSLYIMIPTAESRNAVSGKGIDGIGVTPDIKIDGNKVQDMALLEINKLLAKSSIQPERKKQYEWKIPALEAKLNPQKIPLTLIGNIKGIYEGNRKIIYENETLYYINQSGKYKMDYLGNNTFVVAGKDYRFKFPLVKQPVNSYQAIWDDGGTEEINRINK